MVFLTKTAPLLGLFALCACTTPGTDPQPPPPPPEDGASTVEEGYAADQHDGMLAPGAEVPADGERATVALLIADDWGDCTEIRGRLKNELDGWDVRCNGVNEKDSEHGIMVLSEALKSLQGLPSAKEDVHIYLYGFLTDGHSGSLERLTDFVLRLLSEYDYVVWNNSWGMPRGIYSDADSRRVFSSFTQETERLMVLNPNLFVVYAAGNEGPGEAGYPQSIFSGSDVFVVGATKRDGTTAEFTSWSSSVDYTAHGDDVHVLNKKGKWVQVRGTSFSCPDVSGQIARLVHLDPDQNRQTVMLELASGVEVDSNLGYPNKVVGNGDLTNNRQKAITKAWGPGWTRKYLGFPFVKTKEVDLPQPKGLIP